MGEGSNSQEQTAVICGKGYTKEERDTYFQIQPYSEESRKYNVRTKLKMELVNFNMEKE